MRFYGNGAAAPDLDRVKIALDNPDRPVDVGSGDFTVEWWMKALASENATARCQPGPDNWIVGNILFDRDVYGWGDWGDWGVSLAGGLIAFGVASSSQAAGICSTTDVADGAWHHVAATRRASDGRIRVFVDGVLEGEAASGPTGDISYRDGRQAGWPNEPFLVIGAEKHDVGSEVPSFSGWVEELRLSSIIRYSGGFTPQTRPFVGDEDTAALYHFNEGSGSVLIDSAGAFGGPSHGEVKVGGNPAGPVWSEDTPVGPGGPASFQRASRRIAPLIP